MTTNLSVDPPEKPLSVEQMRRGVAWRRFFARAADGTMTLAVTLALCRPLLLGPEAQVTSRLIALSVWCTLSVLFDAICITAAATTPAKNIFGIRMMSATGRRLAFGEALKRSAQVLVQGQGLNLFPFNVIMLVRSYVRLSQTGSTPWDRGVHVDAPPLALAQKLLALYIFGGTIVVGAVAMFSRMRG